MSDAELRDLERAASHATDGAPWVKLAAALGRLGRFDEAGRALLRARARGARTDEVEDAIAPPGGARFASVPSPGGEERQPVTALAWSADGGLVHAVLATRRVRAFDVAEGRAAPFEWQAPPSMSIAAVASSLDGDLVAVLCTNEQALFPRPEVHLLRAADAHLVRHVRLPADGAMPQLAGFGGASGFSALIWDGVVTATQVVRITATETTIVGKDGWGTLTWTGEPTNPPPSGWPSALSTPTHRAARALLPITFRDSLPLAVSPSGAHLALRGPRMRAVVHDLRDGRAVELDGDVPFCAAFCPSGRRVAFGRAGGSLSVASV